ncbi:hypothetical protein [Neobacillus sp. Marseille-QA0830]
MKETYIKSPAVAKMLDTDSNKVLKAANLIEEVTGYPFTYTSAGRGQGGHLLVNPESNEIKCIQDCIEGGYTVSSKKKQKTFLDKKREWSDLLLGDQHVSQTQTETQVTPLYNAEPKNQEKTLEEWSIQLDKLIQNVKHLFPSGKQEEHKELIVELLQAKEELASAQKHGTSPARKIDMLLKKWNATCPTLPYPIINLIVVL